MALRRKAEGPFPFISQYASLFFRKQTATNRQDAEKTAGSLPAVFSISTTHKQL